MVAHADLCQDMDPALATVSYAMQTDRPETKVVGGGWIARDTDGNYHVTDDFVTRCFQSSPAHRQPQPVAKK